MKRLASRLTWWPTRPHKSTPAVTAAVRRDQPWIILNAAPAGAFIQVVSLPARTVADCCVSVHFFPVTTSPVRWNAGELGV